MVTTVAGISPLVHCAWREAWSQVLEQMQQFGSPSSVFRKLKILMGRGASYHSEQIHPRLDPGDVELSTLNLPLHNNQSPVPYVGENRPVGHVISPRLLPRPLPTVVSNDILSPVNAQQFHRIAQMFPDNLNEARVFSNFPPVNTAESTEGAWVLQSALEYM